MQNFHCPSPASIENAWIPKTTQNMAIYRTNEIHTKVKPKKRLGSIILPPKKSLFSHEGIMKKSLAYMQGSRHLLIVDIIWHIQIMMSWSWVQTWKAIWRGVPLLEKNAEKKTTPSKNLHSTVFCAWNIANFEVPETRTCQHFSWNFLS